MKILIVDDKKENIYLLERLMKASGYQVETAFNGAQALEKIRAGGCDIIISDILMPVMDGFQLCRKVKRTKGLKKIPFVFYTATYTDDRDEEFALQTGADIYIRKPIAPDEFVKIIKTVIEQAEQGRLVGKAPSPIADKDDFEFYSERLVKKLEQKMVELETEIAERKKAEEMLRTSEERYRSLVDNIGIGVSLISPQMEILALNKQMKEWFPAIDDTKRPICYRSFNDPPEKEPCSYCPTIKTLADGQRHEAITRTPRAEGIINYRIISSAIKDRDGKTVCAIETVEDISDRLRFEESLKEAYDIISKSPAVAFLWKNEIGWPVEFVSPNVGSTFGYSAQEFISGTVAYSQTIHPDDLGRVNEEVQNYSSERQRLQFVHEPYRVVTKQGTVRWVDDKTYIRRNSEGVITHYQGIVEDVTERVIAADEKERLEKQLQQAQKMEALGTLAGGVAHDFNNILGGIIGFTELAREGIAKDSPSYRDLDKVLKASQRAKELANHILAFSRKGKAELRPIRIGIVIKEAIKLLRASLPTTIEIRRNIKPEEVVRADPTQIHQILMNLCTNAGHAMREKGGVLEVALEAGELNQFMVDDLGLDIPPGRYLKLTVSDTGHGMGPDVLERIYDPYFTTKDTGEGTGLGLAVVHGIVKAHGGAITVDSVVGKGTLFNIYLPMVEGIDEMADMEDRVEDLPSGHECILLVDDEQDLVEIGKRVLERLGYHVIARTSSIEALELFRSSPARFDLVISDQTMPNMTGSALARELINIRPDIPIILCTGFSETVTEKTAKGMGIKGLVRKPISKRQIATAIREVLDGKTT